MCFVLSRFSGYFAHCHNRFATGKCLPELNCCSLVSIYYLYCMNKKLYDILLYARSPPTSLVLDILWRPCISLTRCSFSSNYSYTIPGGHILTHISLFSGWRRNRAGTWQQCQPHRLTLAQYCGGPHRSNGLQGLGILSRWWWISCCPDIAPAHGPRHHSGLANPFLGGK